MARFKKTSRKTRGIKADEYIFINPMGNGKSNTSKRFYEKDLSVKGESKSGYGFKGITITLDLK